MYSEEDRVLVGYNLQRTEYLGNIFRLLPIQKSKGANAEIDFSSQGKKMVTVKLPISLLSPSRKNEFPFQSLSLFPESLYFYIAVKLVSSYQS